MSFAPRSWSARGRGAQGGIGDGSGGSRRADSVWTFVGLAGRTLLGTVSIIAVARALGTSGYGVYVGVAAYVGLVAPVAIMGVGEVLVRRVARRADELAEAWGTLLLSNLLFGSAGLALVVLAASFVLPGRDAAAITLIGAGEFISAGVTGGHARGFAALGRFRAVALLHIAEGAARAGASVVFWASGSDELRHLGLALVAATTVVAAGSAVAVGRVAGWPRFRIGELAPASREGKRFALAQVSSTMQSSIDRTMLLRAGFESDAGVYGAGVRLLGYTTMPLSAVLSVTYPEFFRRGAEGVDSAVSYAGRLVRPVLGLTVLGAAAGVAIAPFAGRVLGDEFSGVVPVVAAMAAFPILQGAQALLGDVLTGTGRQGYRARAQFSTAVLNVGLNLVLIPPFSWRGAVGATYASEVAYAALLWWAVNRSRSTAIGSAGRSGTAPADGDGPLLDSFVK